MVDIKREPWTTGNSKTFVGQRNPQAAALADLKEEAPKLLSKADAEKVRARLNGKTLKAALDDAGAQEIVAVEELRQINIYLKDHGKESVSVPKGMTARIFVDKFLEGNAAGDGVRVHGHCVGQELDELRLLIQRNKKPTPPVAPNVGVTIPPAPEVIALSMAPSARSAVAQFRAEGLAAGCLPGRKGETATLHEPTRKYALIQNKDSSGGFNIIGAVSGGGGALDCPTGPCLPNVIKH